MGYYDSKDKAQVVLTDFDKVYIKDALLSYAEKNEEELKELSENAKKNGRNYIIAPGFFDMITRDIIMNLKLDKFKKHTDE